MRGDLRAGILGGCGPGIAQAFRGLPLERRCSAAAHGSFYARLGIELSTGEDLDSWNPPKRRFEGVENDENGFPRITPSTPRRSFSAAVADDPARCACR